MIGKFEIKVDEKYIISRVQNGTQMNPYYSADLDAYALNMAKRGWKMWNGDGHLHAIVKDLTVDELLLIMSLDGGEVLYYFPYIKILSTSLGNSTPVGLVNSYISAVMSEPVSEIDYTGDDYAAYIDSFVPVELEAARQKTWTEWVGIGKPTIAVTEIDGYTYFGAHLGNKGFALTGDELLVIHNSADAELVDSKPEVETPII